MKLLTEGETYCHISQVVPASVAFNYKKGNENKNKNEKGKGNYIFLQTAENKSQKKYVHSIQQKLRHLYPWKSNTSIFFASLVTIWL